jgi:hypothetical protein
MIDRDDDESLTVIEADRWKRRFSLVKFQANLTLISLLVALLSSEPIARLSSAFYLIRIRSSFCLTLPPLDSRYGVMRRTPRRTSVSSGTRLLQCSKASRTEWRSNKCRLECTETMRTAINWNAEASRSGVDEGGWRSEQEDCELDRSKLQMEIVDKFGSSSVFDVRNVNGVSNQVRWSSRTDKRLRIKNESNGELIHKLQIRSKSNEFGMRFECSAKTKLGLIELFRIRNECDKDVGSSETKCRLHFKVLCFSGDKKPRKGFESRSIGLQPNKKAEKQRLIAVSTGKHVQLIVGQ